MLKRVADTYNCDIDKASRLNIIEFLNVYAYAIDEEKRKVEEIRKQNAQMRAKYGLKNR